MKVAVIGSTGYSGIELIRFLLQHPYVTIHSVISGSHDGRVLSDIYPHLATIMSDTLEPLHIEKIAKEVELVFFATPSGISKESMPLFMEYGVKCIDISGDFRLRSPEAYQFWYKKEAVNEKYLAQAVYGLSEIFPNEIKGADYIANPGCFPTATLLGIIPVLQQGWIDPQSIIIDGKSGVSGAGRGASLGTHYVEINENVKAYKLGVHQHIPEIEQMLNDIIRLQRNTLGNRQDERVGNQSEDITVTFSTHLIPMTRGIMCTMYTDLVEPKTTSEIIQLYQEFYEEKSFVRIRPEGVWPATKEVYGSNYCDLGFMADPRTGRLTIVSVIDNVVKGAAGQAVQNMNLMQGWEERTGISSTPVFP